MDQSQYEAGRDLDSDIWECCADAENAFDRLESAHPWGHGVAGDIFDVIFGSNLYES